ncbi:MAG TPA: carotenoid 1,2-hydratase, partial [Thermoanaerobaculaceae bacterium]|nr:carotenoid 1,2-hydratase [Thermoanaerobaculaceae bacterium]
MKRGSRFAALALLVAAPATAAEWARVAEAPTLAFPRDHGSHPAFRTEWWYVTGQLADADGRRYGFELTFFRQGLDPSPPAPGSSALRARQVLAAHLAVAEIGKGTMRFAQRVRRIAAGMADAREDDLNLFLDDWEMRRLSNGAITFGAGDRDTGTALTLELQPGKPIVLQGENGLSHKGPEVGNASVYVSFTRLAARGRLTLDGRARTVNGEAWFDHEWGTSQLGAGVVGWDWLGLRLADGRELMLNRLRFADGSAAPQSAGTLVERDGTTRRLAASDFTLEPLSWWTSPRT